MRRSTIEVALSRLRSPEDYQESLSDCLDIAIVMQCLVENLLMLARLDAGQFSPQVRNALGLYRAGQLDRRQAASGIFAYLV